MTAKRRMPRPSAARTWPAVICPLCQTPIASGQRLQPVFQRVRLDGARPHPVLSQPLVVHSVSGPGGVVRQDLSMHDQLVQRATMGGARERQQLDAFNQAFSTVIRMLARRAATAFLSDLERQNRRQGGGAPDS